MAGLKDSDHFQEGERFRIPSRLQIACLALGVGGLLLFFGLRFFQPDEAGAMAYSWLFAVVFFLTLAVGGLFWTLLHHATNSGWGTVVRRLMENVAVMIPFVLVLGLPLLFPQFGFRDALWEWFPKREAALETAAKEAKEEKKAYVAEHREMRNEVESQLEETRANFADIESPSPGHRAHFRRKIASLEERIEELKSVELSDEAVLEKLTLKHFQEEAALLYAKRDYLEPGFWSVRFLIYFAVLAGIAWCLRKCSLKQDGDGNPRWFRWMRRWSCGFIPFFALAWTFLVVDWLMALDYTWFSTMWGVYLFAGCALNSMGLLVLLVTGLRRAGYLREVVTMEHYHLMGKLMLTFVIFWAYIAFSQFFLIWYANITEETKFYLTRNSEFWNVYSVTFLLFGHFIIPFAALLLRHVKKLPLVLSGVAVWNLLMHLLDIYWIIIPERGPSLTAGSGDIQMTIPGAWIYDVIAFLAVGGLFGFFLLRQIGAASLFPCRDPRLDESLNVAN